MAKPKPRIEEFKPDRRLVDERGPTKERVIKLRPSPINLAVARGNINRQQAAAAEKYYSHWYRAGLCERFSTINFDLSGAQHAAPSMHITEAQSFHRDRYRQAVEKVGIRGSWILERVVCREDPFEQCGRDMGWNNKSQAIAAAIQSIRDALDILVNEWGIV